jgi:hypothetical protein
MNSMLRIRVSSGMTRSALSRLGLALAWSRLAWLRPAVHHRRPDGYADRLATLVDAMVLEGHDAGAGPRP